MAFQIPSVSNEDDVVVRGLRISRMPEGDRERLVSLLIKKTSTPEQMAELDQAELVRLYRNFHDQYLDLALVKRISETMV